MSVCTCCQPACNSGKSLLLKHTLSPLKSIWVYLSSISGHCYPPACIPCFIMLNLFFIYTKSAQKLKCPQLLSLSSLLIPLWKKKSSDLLPWLKFSSDEWSNMVPESIVHSEEYVLCPSLLVWKAESLKDPVHSTVRLYVCECILRALAVCYPTPCASGCEVELHGKLI